MKKAALRVLRRRHANLLKPHEESFARAYRGVMRDLKAGVNFASRPGPLTRREWKGRAVEALRPVYRAAILAGGKSYLSSITIRQKAASFYATKAARRASSVVVMSLEEQFQARLEETIDTTFDSMDELLDEAAADGLDAEEIDDLIDEEFDDILGDRTDSIATTETNGAINSVQDYLALQLAELQTWVTAEDDRVRPTHVIYGDAGAKPVGFDWSQLVGGGYTLRYPCDPACHEPAEIVNCRCFTVPAGEVELAPDEMRDYLEDFEMDPEEVMLSEEQTPVYVVNQYTGKGAPVTKGDYMNHPFRGNQYLDAGHAGESDEEGKQRRRLNEARQARHADLVASGHSPEGAAVRVAREQRENVTETAVQRVLTDDLRHPKYRGNPSPYAGHCYVASEAIYHLLGGKKAGYVPQFIRHEGQPHWFLRSPDGRVIDPTRDQFKTPVPYDKGKGKGFLTAQPSKRAARVMLRVRGKKAPFGRTVTKDFNPDQARDERGRWVDIFGSEQPSEAPPEAQTEDAAAPGYAVDPEDASQPQAGPPRMADADYEKKNEEWNDKADAIAKENKAKLLAEAERFDKAREELQPQIAAANAKSSGLNQASDSREEALRVASGEEYDRAKARAEDLTQQRVDVDQKRDALIGKLTEEEIAKLPEDKRAEIDALNAEHDRLTEELKGMTETYLRDRWGGTHDWEDGRDRYASKVGDEYTGLASQLKYDPLAMRATADALDKIAAETKDGEYKTGDVKTDLVGRNFDIPTVGNAEQMKDAAAYLRASADSTEAAVQAQALADSNSAILRNISDTSNALKNVDQQAEIQAAAKMGVDFVAEKSFRDDKFYNAVHERTADEWQHIGGQGPATFRFASQMAFGLDEGGTFDSKAGRFITDLDDLDKTYPGAKDEATVQAGALRREYMETQAEIADGFTFNLAGDEDIDSDALSEMESEAWNNLSDSDKEDIVQGSKKLNQEAVEYGSEHIEEVEEVAREEDGDNEPLAFEYVTAEQARQALPHSTDEIDAVDRFMYGRNVEEEQRDRDLATSYQAVERAGRQAQGAIRFDYGFSTAPAFLESQSRSIEETIRDEERSLQARYDTDEEAAASPEGQNLARLKESYESVKAQGDAADAMAWKSVGQEARTVAEDVRQWSKDTISDFDGAVKDKLDPSALQDVDPDLSSEHDTNDSAYEAWQERHDEWIDPYYRIPYIKADPDGSIFEKFIENYEPDEYPRTEPEEITINADDWPHKLIRTVSADVSNYTPNYAESWAYDRQSFGSQTLTDDIDASQILVFQGAKNWTTPAGQNSMGSRENEFIVLSQPPKWVREARERWEKVQAGQLRERESEGKRAQRESLMSQYRELQRLQDFGTEEQHRSKRDEVERLASALGVDWDTLVEMARKK